ncbi:hypothetical protein DPMN_107004 [Dreissena polymorpha]|uniref:TNFR-Cys domain-containing protein n=1 Tax=Dreissena polymorpha TaxID=45954 RepID=A0A9D4K5Y6_DREPO|nr:hypothetical protein DPMN_107004 [Dreissena polymorpha]
MELSYKIVLITIYILPFDAFDVSSNSIPRCSARENTYWNTSKHKCSPCRTCSAGTARNLNIEIELKTGPYGDEECFPCQECPKDHYVYIPTLEFLLPYCTKCSADCASVNRYRKKACSSQSNLECGDCLPGYENKYGNSDFPCTKKTPVKSFSETTTPVANPANTQVLVGSPHQGNESVGGFASLPMALHVLIIVLAVIAVFVIAAISGAFACHRYCPRKSTSMETLSTISAEYSSLSTSEVEMDGGGKGREQKLVRGELANPVSLPPDQLSLLAGALKSFNRTTSNWGALMAHMSAYCLQAPLLVETMLAGKTSIASMCK